ncbi:hypothetical protein SEPCBS57363_002062 [Sporothrix epigloea]|uniref:Uncharacterized protein n=1 Tax=Sporothrix epigloea TaxID=1892477 RepID=A0ABP0DHR4_9PEZI
MAVFDNSGRGPLRVPVFSGIPINYELPVVRRFAHGFQGWQQRLMITAQETAMVAIMDRLTDKPDWFIDISDDAVVARWRAELKRDRFIANPRLMRGKTWAWCVQELCDKAVYFQEHHHIRVLDTGACVCKADSAELLSLGAVFRSAVEPIAGQHKRYQERKMRAQRNEHAEKNQMSQCGERASDTMTDAQSTHDTSEAFEDEHAAGDHDIAWHLNTLQERSEDEALAFSINRHPNNLSFFAHAEDPFDSGYSDNSYWDWYRQHSQGMTPDIHGGTVKFEDMSVSYNSARATLSQVPGSLQNLTMGPLLVETCDWSPRYQSLPCEVEFVPGGQTNSEVNMTSYINGLHPDNTELYGAIERVLSCCIKPWNDCLVRGCTGIHDWNNIGHLGPVPARIVTYGVEWENELPKWAIEIRVPTESRRRTYKRRLRSDLMDNVFIQRVCWDVIDKEHLQLPPRDSKLWQLAREYLCKPELSVSSGTARAEPMPVPDAWDVGDERTWKLLCENAIRMLRCKHPEPGTAFSYEEWKTDRHGSRPLIDKVEPVAINFPEHTFPPAIRPPHIPHSVALQDTFRDQGLQELVEISSIELTPETPAYGPDTAARTEAYRTWADGRMAEALSNNTYVKLAAQPDTDGWKVAGQLNEHIAAVAMFAFDAENVTEPRVAFRQELKFDHMIYRYNDCYSHPYKASGSYKIDGPAHLIDKAHDTGALTEILGMPNLEFIPDNTHYAYQHTGSVAARQGRLVTFPNVLEHRFDPFRLVDETKPGRYRWLTLYLVDPHYRVCSTRNVPPQQHDWWAAAVGSELAAGAGLPMEVVDNIMRYTDEWPMGMEEAEQHREQMVKDRQQLIKEFYYDG